MKWSDNVNLSDLSPWMAKYHWYGGENFIELPGQHNGTAPPNPINTLKIVKFHENAMIFSSLRRPIKISVLCSDGKTYSLLAKYGEDLRQDDHIQQIQKLMSDLLKADKNCSQQKLSIFTYNVIPMTVDCGIISWIENTETIQSLLSKSIPNAEEVLRQFKQFLAEGNTPAKKTVNDNIAAVLHYTPNKVSRSNITIILELNKKLNDFFVFYFF